MRPYTPQKDRPRGPAAFLPAGADWHAADIQAALKKRGLTQTELSRRAGYDKSAIGKALCRSWPAIERLVAAALDQTPQEIWPSRYDAAGRPIGQRRTKGSTTKTARNVHLGAA
jgi:Ner family transcriptional regulator